MESDENVLYHEPIHQLNILWFHSFHINHNGRNLSLLFFPIQYHPIKLNYQMGIRPWFFEILCFHITPWPHWSQRPWLKGLEFTTNIFITSKMERRIHLVFWLKFGDICKFLKMSDGILFWLWAKQAVYAIWLTVVVVGKTFIQIKATYWSVNNLISMYIFRNFH